jgi:hypothetical protein
MKRIALISLFAIISILGYSSNILAQWFLDFENGLVTSGYNDVQIPRDTGTRFSLTDDLKTDSSYFFRIRFGYHWKCRHTISVFAAPLTLKAAGKVDKEVVFFEKTFPANTPFTAQYTFNSYRLTYRYDFVRKQKWEVGIGFTAKIRDAVVKVEGDAAAAAQGRAEDVLLTLQYSLNEKVHFRAGYRFIEGGADVEEVYNFSLIHFFSAGLTISF